MSASRPDSTGRRVSRSGPDWYTVLPRRGPGWSRPVIGSRPRKRPYLGLIVQHRPFRRLDRQHLTTAAGVLTAISLALLVHQNQVYMPVYHTFPVADWLDLTVGPDDAARFGSAERLVMSALPLLDGFQVGVAEHRLLVGFPEPHLRRQVAGLASSYALAFARPPAARAAPDQTRLHGRLELRVFHRAKQAGAYLGLRTMQLATTKTDLVEVTPLLPNSSYRVWINVPAEKPVQEVEVRVIGRVGPGQYEVSVSAAREAADWSGHRADLIERTQAFAERLATAWQASLAEAWP